MKLESLNSSKFEKFKHDEMDVFNKVLGGEALPTRKPGSTINTDCWDDSTGNDIHTESGKHYDKCSTTPSE